MMMVQMEELELGNEWLCYPQDKERSLLGYAGLVNLGATCYMNSLIQQLYFIPNFRYVLSNIGLLIGADNRFY